MWTSSICLQEEHPEKQAAVDKYKEELMHKQPGVGCAPGNACVRISLGWVAHPARLALSQLWVPLVVRHGQPQFQAACWAVA